MEGELEEALEIADKKEKFELTIEKNNLGAYDRIVKI